MGRGPAAGRPVDQGAEPAVAESDLLAMDSQTARDVPFPTLMMVAKVSCKRHHAK